MNQKFSTKLFDAIQKNSPFVLYRKPNEDLVRLLVQDHSNQNKFLFHSFDSKTEKLISDAHPVSISQNEFEFDFQLDLNATHKLNTVKKSDYEKLIQKTIESMQNSDLKKVVISRIIPKKNSDYNLVQSYKNLLLNQPNALVYLWHNPGEETWLGATPELLLSQKKSQIQTVSLAGTKLPDAKWTAKEFEEQKIVTDYIVHSLHDLDRIEVRGPETVQAGKFQHLKSYISAELSPEISVNELVEKLHPTPAVCGLPKKDAFDFIQKNEGYNRSYYTGYLGIVEKDSTEYFVNLRCAQLFENQIWVYVGGGITAESHPGREWEETELKSGTILNSLK